MLRPVRAADFFDDAGLVLRGAWRGAGRQRWKARLARVHRQAGASARTAIGCGREPAPATTPRKPCRRIWPDSTIATCKRRTSRIRCANRCCRHSSSAHPQLLEAECAPSPAQRRASSWPSALADAPGVGCRHRATSTTSLQTFAPRSRSGCGEPRGAGARTGARITRPIRRSRSCCVQRPATLATAGDDGVEHLACARARRIAPGVGSVQVDRIHVHRPAHLARRLQRIAAAASMASARPAAPVALAGDAAPGRASGPRGAPSAPASARSRARSAPRRRPRAPRAGIPARRPRAPLRRAAAPGARRAGSRPPRVRPVPARPRPDSRRQQRAEQRMGRGDGSATAPRPATAARPARPATWISSCARRLAGAEIGGEQAFVDADHHHQRQPRQVMALGQHLRADQDAGGSPNSSQLLLQRPAPPRGARGRRASAAPPGNACRQRFLEPLGAEALRLQRQARAVRARPAAADRARRSGGRSACGRRRARSSPNRSAGIARSSRSRGTAAPARSRGGS